MPRGREEGGGMMAEERTIEVKREEFRNSRKNLKITFNSTVLRRLIYEPT